MDFELKRFPLRILGSLLGGDVKKMISITLLGLPLLTTSTLVSSLVFVTLTVTAVGQNCGK